MPENQFGQPIGEAVTGWVPSDRPAPKLLTGQHVRLEPLAAEHAEPLFEALCGVEDHSLWTYRADEPPASVGEMARYVAEHAESRQGTTYAVVPTAGPGAGTARGLTSLMRDDPANGSIEVGGVIYARDLQRTAAATEATYLLATHVFDLGYRRLEWKLDRLNEPSARAARRLGFREEGTFRQHLVYKDRNRDTTWFALTDADWARVRPRLEEWLDPANFDQQGRQRRRIDVRGG